MTKMIKLINLIILVYEPTNASRKESANKLDAFPRGFGYLSRNFSRIRFKTELEPVTVALSLHQPQHPLHLCPQLRHFFPQRSDLGFHLGHARPRPSVLDSFHRSDHLGRFA